MISGTWTGAGGGNCAAPASGAVAAALVLKMVVNQRGIFSPLSATGAASAAGAVTGAGAGAGFTALASFDAVAGSIFVSDTVISPLFTGCGAGWS